jgi:hypothetical protein
MTDARKAPERPRRGISDDEIRAVAEGFAPILRVEIARALVPLEARITELEENLQAALQRRSQ